MFAVLRALAVRERATDGGGMLDAASPAASEVKARLQGGSATVPHMEWHDSVLLKLNVWANGGLLVSMAETCAPDCCRLICIIYIPFH